MTDIKDMTIKFRDFGDRINKCNLESMSGYNLFVFLTSLSGRSFKYEQIQHLFSLIFTNDGNQLYNEDRDITFYEGIDFEMEG